MVKTTKNCDSFLLFYNFNKNVYKFMFKMKFFCERNHYKKKFWNVLKRLFFKTKTFYFIKLIFFL